MRDGRVYNRGYIRVYWGYIGKMEKKMEIISINTSTITITITIFTIIDITMIIIAIIITCGGWRHGSRNLCTAKSSIAELLDTRLKH